MKLLLACWLTAIAVLVWLAMPRPSTFEKRSPIETIGHVLGHDHQRSQGGPTFMPVCKWEKCRLS